MRLTEAGEAFYKKIKDAMELISSAENDLEVITSMETGSINIGDKETDTPEQYSKKNDQFSFVDDESENGWPKATSVWDK